MKSLLISLLIFCGGCVGSPFDTTDHDNLLIYYTRQTTLDAENRHRNEINNAVKNFQIQAIKAGFAYWDVVDYTGKVEFKWIQQKGNK